MIVREIADLIEACAPLDLQEKYDNAGLIVGNPLTQVQAVLLTVDVTEEVVIEAVRKKCNLIVAHHPFIFSPLKRITGANDVERTLISAIKNDVAIYAAHTNLDNSLSPGVNSVIASKLGLNNCRVLLPKENALLKLITYVPVDYADRLRMALFDAGAGRIGNYDNCSFSSDGTGTFRALDGANPFVGTLNEQHVEPECRIELVLPAFAKNKVMAALIETHPYEEPAFDLIALQNQWDGAGSGVVGDLDNEMDALDFLSGLKSVFSIPALRFTSVADRKIKRVALCGGAGSFLINRAIAAQADIFISSDFKYHDFFLAENRIIIADIGHFESEQFTKDIFYEIITKKMPTFAVQFSETKTNPINYL